MCELQLSAPCYQPSLLRASCAHDSIVPSVHTHTSHHGIPVNSSSFTSKQAACITLCVHSHYFSDKKKLAAVNTPKIMSHRHLTITKQVILSPCIPPVTEVTHLELLILKTLLEYETWQTPDNGFQTYWNTDRQHKHMKTCFLRKSSPKNAGLFSFFFFKTDLEPQLTPQFALNILSDTSISACHYKRY